jgi:hypothetical protein
LRREIHGVCLLNPVSCRIARSSLRHIALSSDILIQPNESGQSLIPEFSKTAAWRARLAIHWPVTLVLLACLIAGVALGDDYGMSWDEDRNADVGADALQVYLGSNAYFSDDSLADHGPAYFMIQSISSTAITKILPGWTLADGRHLTN